MKKKLVSALLALCMLPALMGAGKTAAQSEINISAEVEGLEISSVEVEGKTYLFLPSNADVSELCLRFEIDGGESDEVVLTGENGSLENAETINLLDVAEKDSLGRYVVYAEANGLRECFYILKGDAISTMYLSSDNGEEDREWIDSSKEHKTTGAMVMVSADGTTIYDGALTQIKTRGNSTFGYPKKAYQIKLDKKTDLLGNGEKVKTWVLLANYADATLIHDKLFKDLAAKLGMAYTASCDWINLYYDGEYRGVYLLGEKNSVESAGVDITDMEETYEELNDNYGDDAVITTGINVYGQKYQYTADLVEPENVTGGYLIEKNHDYIDEANGFFTAQGVAFNVKSPEYGGQSAMEYISEYYQAFENALYATDENGNFTGYNAETGKYYYEYCDLESLVQTYLIQKLGMNNDAYRSSFYFYKDANEIMYAGPVWDMDLSCGSGWEEKIASSRDYIDMVYLGEALSKIPGFVSAACEYYTYTFRPEIEKLLAEDGTIVKYVYSLSANAEMNYILWPYVRVGNPEKDNHFWAEGTDYTTVTNDMKTWLSQRLASMDIRYKLRVFDDVTPTDWEYMAVRFTSSRGILYGVSVTSFDPDSTAARGMIYTVLARMAGESTTPEEGESWMQPGIDWAIAKGISDGTNPEAAITREQLATMLWRYEGQPEGEGALDKFSDGADVSVWAADAMQWAVGAGIFKGDGAGVLNPGGTATRAEIAQVIYNYLA